MAAFPNAREDDNPFAREEPIQDFLRLDMIDRVEEVVEVLALIVEERL